MVFDLGEFFCGPGGIAHGARLAGTIKNCKDTYSIRCKWATDYDLDTCKTYAHNIHGEPWEKVNDIVFHEDIRKADIAAFPGSDAFAFGFPCNDFSIVGETLGLKGEFGPLFSYGVKYLTIHEPKWFVAENVGGLTSANEGKAFELILRELRNAGPGYTLTPHLYKFEQYGVPQSRHRIIIVGIRNDQDCTYRVPAPTHSSNYKTAKDAFSNPPIPANAPNQEKTRQSQSVVERLKHIGPGENAWNANIPEHLQLNVKGAKLSNIYRRLDPNKPAYTVTGSGGGGTHMYHWEEPRALTNRERARLQTFPDSYEFLGPKESVRKQIGMAVPPQGMAIVFKAILESYAKVEYPSVPSNLERGFQGREKSKK